MKLFPQSIANRTTLVLIAGLILVMILTAVAARLIAQREDKGLNHHHLIERAHIITKLISKTPSPDRAHIATLLNEPDFSVQWMQTDVEFTNIKQDWASNKLADYLAKITADLDIKQLIVGHAQGASTSEKQSGNHHNGPIIARIQLQDDSWLQFTHTRKPHDGTWVLRLIIGVGVFGGGITLLAIWTTRKIIQPLEQFTAASQRFGINVEAPALPEAGPTEIKNAAQTFNQMQRRIRTFVQERMEMIAAISHDLKTPLTRLRLRTEFISDPSQRQKALADLDEMQLILNSTLSFAREDTNKEARTDVDIAALLQSLCNDLSDAGEQIQYQGPDHLTYHCAPVSLRRALSNLINNAIQYGGQADIELSQTAAAVRISIGDRGPGIADDQKEQVFSPFYRVEKSRNRETGGTGLGLTVARTVVRQHGGDVELQSRPGGGLLVLVSLPYN